MVLSSCSIPSAFHQQLVKF